MWGWEKSYTISKPRPKELFEQANEALGFRITDLMFPEAMRI